MPNSGQSSNEERKMESLIDIYDYAEREDISVYWYPLKKSSSISLPANGFDNGAIAIDPWKMDSCAKEKTCLIHEIGHCKTGAFYNKYATCDVRQKHENRANKWAIKRFIKESKLDQAIADGYTEIWSLAEYFNVTEDFMRKAVCWYSYGNLAADLYF